MLSAISSVQEKIINYEILNNLESYKLTQDKQYGFRRRRLTADPLTFVTHIWNDYKQSYWETPSVELDITKIFVQVCHAALMSEPPSDKLPLDSCNGGNAGFLSSQSTKVIVDGHFKISAGVPQSFYSFFDSYSQYSACSDQSCPRLCCILHCSTNKQTYLF